MRFIIVLALIFLGLSVNAQSILGRAIVNGQTVLILSDGTWRYESTSSKECHLVALDLSFCGSSEIWKKVRPDNPEITAQYKFDDLHYGMIISEGLGSDDGVDLATLREIALENASYFSGGTASDVPVLDIYIDRIDEMEADTMIYVVKLNDLNFVYANTMLILPQMTLQAATMAVGSQFTDKHKEIHALFLENVVLE